jgi:hypothetical protein
MNMILNPTDNLGHAVHAFDDPAGVRMKTWLPIDLDKRQSFLSREDEVIVRTEEG